MEKGTFYFQWVHNEDSITREPWKHIDKNLYLVYVKDLHIKNRRMNNLPVPKRIIQYRPDELSKHLYSLVLAHANLVFYEPNHLQLCNCKVQIDN